MRRRWREGGEGGKLPFVSLRAHSFFHALSLFFVHSVPSFYTHVWIQFAQLLTHSFERRAELTHFITFEFRCTFISDDHSERTHWKAFDIILWPGKKLFWFFFLINVAIHLKPKRFCILISFILLTLLSPTCMRTAKFVRWLQVQIISLFDLFYQRASGARPRPIQVGSAIIRK